jgi:hypothetical protein
MLLGDTLDTATQPTQTVGFQSIVDDIFKAATAYLSFDQQRALMNLNTQRAAQGLPALSPEQYAAGVNVGLTNSTQTTLLWIAGGLGAAFILSSFLKRERR